MKGRTYLEENFALWPVGSVSELKLASDHAAVVFWAMRKPGVSPHGISMLRYRADKDGWRIGTGKGMVRVNSMMRTGRSTARSFMRRPFMNAKIVRIPRWFDVASARSLSTWDKVGSIGNPRQRCEWLSVTVVMQYQRRSLLTCVIRISEWLDENISWRDVWKLAILYTNAGRCARYSIVWKAKET